MRRAALLLAAAVLAGCGSGGAASRADGAAASTSSLPAGPSVAPVPGIEAEAVRLRTDEAIGGQVQVRVTDTGEEPFTVTSVAIDSPGFAPLPAKAVTAHYAPGQVIDLPTPFGDPVCSAAAEPAAARLTVVRPDGTAQDLRVPLAAEILGRIHADECAVLAVEQVVAIAVTDLHEDGDAVKGTLTLTRPGGSGPAVSATRLGRSVLMKAAAHLPLTLARDRATASAEVSFTLASCDPHVLAETKKPYVFPLAVTVGSGDPVPVDLPLDQAQKEQLAALVDRVCELPH